MNSNGKLVRSLMVWIRLFRAIGSSSASACLRTSLLALIAISPLVIAADTKSAGPPGTPNTGVTPTVSYPQYRGCNLVGGGAQGAWTGWTGANVATRNPGQGPRTPANYEFVTNEDID